jgi:hypothetical protein
MCAMSLIQSRQSSRPTNASIPEVVVGALVTLFSLLTVQMSALTAYVDTVGQPGGLSSNKVDELGQPLYGWSQRWHEYGPLLWGVYALALLVLVVWMWRLIMTRPPRVGWALVPVLLAISSVFWALNLDRFYS